MIIEVYNNTCGSAIESIDFLSPVICIRSILRADELGRLSFTHRKLKRKKGTFIILKKHFWQLNNDIGMMSASQNYKRLKQKRPRPQWSDSSSIQIVLLACSIFSIAESKTYVRRTTFKIPSFPSELNNKNLDDNNDDGKFRFMSANQHGVSTSDAPKRIGSSRSLPESFGFPTESPQDRKSVV